MLRRHLPATALPLGDGPVREAARMMGVTVPDFQKLFPEWRKQEFPEPDPVSGLFDLDAIVLWRRLRHPKIYGLNDLDQARDARGVAESRIAGLFPHGQAR